MSKFICRLGTIEAQRKGDLASFMALRIFPLVEAYCYFSGGVYFLYICKFVTISFVVVSCFVFLNCLYVFCWGKVPVVGVYMAP